MIYTFDSRVRFSEINEQGDLTLTAMMNYLQDCCTFHSEDVGDSVFDALKLGQVWMVIAWQIRIRSLPRMAQHITIGTMITTNDVVMAQRNFFIRDDDGKDLIEARSCWTKVNLAAGRAVRIRPAMVACYEPEAEGIDMPPASRKIPIPAEGGRELTPFTVTPEMIDTNHHMNNARYIQLAVDAVTQADPSLCSFLTAPVQIRVEYKLSAFLGDEIVPVLYRTEQGILVSLNRKDGGEFAAVSFEKEM